MVICAIFKKRGVRKLQNHDSSLRFHRLRISDSSDESMEPNRKRTAFHILLNRALLFLTDQFGRLRTGSFLGIKPNRTVESNRKLCSLQK